MSSRRFTEREAAAIVRKAAETQAKTTESSSNEGVTELELRAAAKELGIHGPAIDAALQTVGGQEENNRPGVFGGHFRHEVETVFEGTLSDETWEEILLEVRRTFGEVGTVERRGTTHEWSCIGGGIDKIIVTLRQTGNTVRLQISSDFRDKGFVGYLLTALPFFITVAVLSKVTLPGMWELWIGMALASVYLLIARGWTIATSRKRSRTISKLVRHVESILQTKDEQPKSIARTSIRNLPEEPVQDISASI